MDYKILLNNSVSKLILFYKIEVFFILPVLESN